jgi:hypothetical protein
MAAKRVERRTNDKRHNRQGKERHSKQDDGRGATGKQQEEGGRRYRNGVSTSAISFGPVDYGCAWSAAGQHAQAASLIAFCWSAGHDPVRIPQIQDSPGRKRCNVCRPRDACLHSIRRLRDCIAAWMSEVIKLPIPMIIARSPARSGVDDDRLTSSSPSVVES